MDQGTNPSKILSCIICVMLLCAGSSHNKNANVECARSQERGLNNNFDSTTWNNFGIPKTYGNKTCNDGYKPITAIEKDDGNNLKTVSGYQGQTSPYGNSDKGCNKRERKRSNPHTQFCVVKCIMHCDQLFSKAVFLGRLIRCLSLSVCDCGRLWLKDEKHGKHVHAMMPGIPGRTVFEKPNKQMSDGNQDFLENIEFGMTERDQQPNNKLKPEISGTYGFSFGKSLTVYGHESNIAVYNNRPGIPGILKSGYARLNSYERYNKKTIFVNKNVSKYSVQGSRTVSATQLLCARDSADGQGKREVSLTNRASRRDHQQHQSEDQGQASAGRRQESARRGSDVNTQRSNGRNQQQEKGRELW